MQLNVTTPRAISDNVIKLRDHLGLSSEPVFVPVEVNAAAIHGDCFKNVSEKIATSGGQLQYGWTVWESPDQLIEGEFHAVWVSPEDRFVDVTPKPDGEKKIVSYRTKSALTRASQ